MLTTIACHDDIDTLPLDDIEAELHELECDLAWFMNTGDTASAERTRARIAQLLETE